MLYIKSCILEENITILGKCTVQIGCDIKIQDTEKFPHEFLFMFLLYMSTDPNRIPVPQNAF